MRWPTLLLGCLLSTAWAADLDPECHRLYEFFNQPNLTYEDVGKIADKMHEAQCWPILMGLADDSSGNELPPLINDCNSLAPHVVQMTKDQAGENNPAIIKLYGVQALDAQFCSGKFLKNERGELLLSRVWPDMGFYKTCGLLMDAPTFFTGPAKVGDPTKVLNCIGTARYEYGYAQDEERYFYLERFPDGEEFLGISPLTQ